MYVLYLLLELALLGEKQNIFCIDNYEYENHCSSIAVSIKQKIPFYAANSLHVKNYVDLTCHAFFIISYAYELLISIVL